MLVTKAANHRSIKLCRGVLDDHAGDTLDHAASLATDDDTHIVPPFKCTGHLNAASLLHSGRSFVSWSVARIYG